MISDVYGCMEYHRSPTQVNQSCCQTLDSCIFYRMSHRSDTDTTQSDDDDTFSNYLMTDDRMMSCLCDHGNLYATRADRTRWHQKTHHPHSMAMMTHATMQWTTISDVDHPLCASSSSHGRAYIIRRTSFCAHLRGHNTHRHVHSDLHTLCYPLPSHPHQTTALSLPHLCSTDDSNRSQTTLRWHSVFSVKYIYYSYTIFAINDRANCTKSIITIYKGNLH